MRSGRNINQDWRGLEGDAAASGRASCGRMFLFPFPLRKGSRDRAGLALSSYRGRCAERQAASRKKYCCSAFSPISAAHQSSRCLLPDYTSPASWLSLPRSRPLFSGPPFTRSLDHLLRDLNPAEELPSKLVVVFLESSGFFFASG